MTVDDFKEVLGAMFTATEELKLAKLHPDLVRVVRKAREMGAKFKIGDTLRNLAQQKVNLAKGVSKTLHSRHLPGRDGLARAIDLLPLVDGKPVITDWHPYYVMAPIVKAAAKKCNVDVTWGGDWRSFKDGPHWELPRRKYP